MRENFFEKIKIERVEVQGKVYRYALFGSEFHGRWTFRLWVSSGFQRGEDGREFVQFPLVGHKVERTEKGNYVLRRNDGFWVANVFVRCGFRGGSGFEFGSEVEEVFPYSVYHSPRGSIGISKGALVNIPISVDRLVVNWTKSGRLYGNPSKGIIVLYQDGSFEEVPGVSLEQFEEVAVEEVQGE